MRPLLGVASAALLILAPLGAAAQGHGGHWGGGGGHWGGGYHGHYGYGYGYGAGYFVGGLGLGLALGAYPWYYGGPGYYGYYGYGVPAYYAYDYGPPPVDYGPPPDAVAPPQACGAWSWVAQQNRYVWVPAACAVPSA